jgi:hypothetical protein
MKSGGARILFFLLLAMASPHANAGLISRCGAAIRASKDNLAAKITKTRKLVGINLGFTPHDEAPYSQNAGFMRRQGPVQWWAIPFFPVVYPIRSFSFLIHWVRGDNLRNFTYPSVFRGILQNIYVAPARGLTTILLREPLLKYFGDRMNPELKEFLQKPLDPSGAIDFVLAFVAFHFLYQGVNAFNQHLIVNDQNNWIDQDAPFWLQLLRTDPYYSRINSLFKKGLLTEKQAIQEAFVRASSLDLLYTLINEKREERDGLADRIFKERELKDAFGPILPATFYLKENGPSANKNFDIPQDQLKPASVEQRRQLIALNVKLLRRRSVVRAFFESPRMYKQLKQSPPHAAVLKELLEDEQIKFYMSKWENEVISDAQAQYLFLEWIQIRENYERWAVFGAKRKFIDSDGAVAYLDIEKLFRWRQANLLGDLPEQFMELDIYPSEVSEFRKRLNEPLSGQLNKLVFLRSVEPGMRQVWNGLEKSVRFMGEGSTRSTILGEKYTVTAAASAAGGEATVELKGAGALARSMAIISTGVVYSDIYLRWRDLNNVEEYVKKTGREILYIED